MVSKKAITVFTQLSDEKEATKPDLCVRLWNYVNHLPINDCAENEEGSSDNAVPQDVEYILRRLIQGLGSTRAFIRKNYFATLMSLISHWNFSHSQISMSYFKSLVDKNLSKFESKGEEGEILTGRILAYGVALRSKLFLKADVELQHEVLTEMLTKSKERSYLPLLAYSFVNDFMKDDTDEETFKKVVWPVLKNHVLVDWSHQTFETLICLIEIQKRHPYVLKEKLMLPIFNTSSVFHIDTIEIVQKMLTNITWEPCLKNPAYNTICSYLCHCDNPELRLKFWECVENVLKSSPTRLQQLAVLKIFRIMVETSKLEELFSLLTPYFLDYLINTCRSSMYKTDILTVNSREALQFLISHVIDNKEEEFIYAVFCKILFDSKYLLVDKITGIKVVSPCISKLNAKYIKLVAKKCKSVVFSSKKDNCNNAQHRWNFKERCYATHLLARLISHPASQDLDWKIKYLKLMMKNALFSSVAGDSIQINNELSGTLKNSFFSALSHQLSHLENHRMVLISLVFYIDNILTTEEYQLRNSLTDEMMVCWKNTMGKIQKIDLKISKTGKQKTVMYVFQTLFLQMALHLFVDPSVAKDVLNELDTCYKKEKSQHKMKKLQQNEDLKSECAESHWIETVVELLLSLLSRDTYSLRQPISRIFPHLCPYLTAQAAFQILQVFDPTSNNNILTEGNDSEDESSDDDGNEENKNEDGKNTMEVNAFEEESDSEVEEEEDVEESAIEKTRQAVRDALGVAGSVTDTESIDLDDIDEEDGRKLDMALSEAFRTIKKPQSGKNKKQSPSEKALTNFRIRVLDLVDIYLENEPSFSLVLDTIPPLFALLEFCIKDNHQKPLENRLRSTLRKISSLKKFSNLDGVVEETLANILKVLMDKGVRTTSVFLNVCHEMSECCVFLLKMAIQIFGNDEDKSCSEIFNIFATSVDSFFLKRDCLLPVSLFENIFTKTNWKWNTKLCHRILSLSFNPSVRGFRRNQGLILIGCFYKNTRLLSTLKKYNCATLGELEDEILKNANMILTHMQDKNDQSLKPSFLSELFTLLHSIKVNKLSAGSRKWKKLSNTLQTFSSNGSSMQNATRKLMHKLCCSLQITTRNKQSPSCKRKLQDIDEGADVQENGYVVQMQNDNSNEEESPVNVNKDDEAVSSNKIMMKKKGKRKTKEHFESKKLRSELANDVKLLKFSSANISET